MIHDDAHATRREKRAAVRLAREHPQLINQPPDEPNSLNATQSALYSAVSPRGGRSRIILSSVEQSGVSVRSGSMLDPNLMMAARSVGSSALTSRTAALAAVRSCQPLPTIVIEVDVVDLSDVAVCRSHAAFP
jgi:hypothetical protein